LVAFARVGQADAARIAGRAAVGDAANRALRGKLGVGEREQVSELLGRQAGDAEAHGDSPDDVAASVWPGRRAPALRLLRSNRVRLLRGRVCGTIVAAGEPRWKNSRSSRTAACRNGLPTTRATSATRASTTSFVAACRRNARSRSTRAAP